MGDLCTEYRYSVEKTEYRYSVEKTEIPPREVTLVANLIDQFKITSKKTTTLFNYYDNEKSERRMWFRNRV